MKILGIETSCDETALCILEAKGDLNAPQFSVVATSLFSQIDIHKEYGGVFPMLAKREHGLNLVPLFKKLLEDAGNLKLRSSARTDTEAAAESAKHSEKIETTTRAELEKLLEKEPQLSAPLIEFLAQYEKPHIDAIAVTTGPGLEPALWVGINFARALHAAWNIPIIPVNHMEGHIVSPLLSENMKSASSTEKKPVEFPALALLISGGHTELVLIKHWGDYKILGQTRDDAVGEAFDKVARMLHLPYPGGPQISRLAEMARTHKTSTPPFKLPRPMIKTDDYDFSFAGLKTAALYGIRDHGHLSESETQGLAQEFEDAVAEVLVTKTMRAAEEFGIKTLIIGGGVVANKFIRQTFEEKLRAHPDISLLVPTIDLATDNAVMIAMAGYFNHLLGKTFDEPQLLKAHGNMKLS